MKWLIIAIIGFVSILLIVGLRTHGNEIKDLNDRIDVLERELSALADGQPAVGTAPETTPEMVPTPTEGTEALGQIAPEEIAEMAEEIYGFAGVAGPSRLDKLELSADAITAELEDIRKAVFHAPAEEIAPVPGEEVAPLPEDEIAPAPQKSRIDDIADTIAELKIALYGTVTGTPTFRIDDIEAALSALEYVVYDTDGTDLSTRVDALETAVVELGGTITLPEDTVSPPDGSAPITPTEDANGGTHPPSNGSSEETAVH